MSAAISPPPRLMGPGLHAPAPQPVPVVVMEPHRLDVPKPAPASRYFVKDPTTGIEVEQLYTTAGDASAGHPGAGATVCFQFVRTLQDSLMGKVKSAVVCVPQADGSFAAPTVAPFTMVAIKQLFKSCVFKGETRDGKKVKEDPMNEVAILAYLGNPAPGHPNIMRLLHFMEDADHYYIVYEHLNGGELFDQISAYGRLKETIARRFFYDTVQGLRFMHGRGVCHRDISLENIMLHREEHVVAEEEARQLITTTPDATTMTTTTTTTAGAGAAAASSSSGANTGPGGGGGQDPDAWQLSPQSPPLSSPSPSSQGTSHSPGMAMAEDGGEEERMVIVQAPPTGKIIDFGLAVVIPQLPPAHQLPPHIAAQIAASAAAAQILLKWDGRVGKERYMAAETYSGRHYDGRKVDIWCAGLTLFVLLYGIFPYKQPSAKHCAYFQQVEAGRLLAMLRDWGYDKLVSPEALDLLDRMLRVDPSRRISIEDIHRHPWLAPERERAAASAAAVEEAQAMLLMQQQQQQQQAMMMAATPPAPTAKGTVDAGSSASPRSNGSGSSGGSASMGTALSSSPVPTSAGAPSSSSGGGHHYYTRHNPAYQSSTSSSPAAGSGSSGGSSGHSSGRSHAHGHHHHSKSAMDEDDGGSGEHRVD